MSADAKRHYGSTLILLALGLLALYGGTRWLLAVIPAAALVWYIAGGWRGRKLQDGRLQDGR